MGFTRHQTPIHEYDARCGPQMTFFLKIMNRARLLLKRSTVPVMLEIVRKK